MMRATGIDDALRYQGLMARSKNFGILGLGMAAILENPAHFLLFPLI